jgi:hypothetical protein
MPAGLTVVVSSPLLLPPQAPADSATADASARIEERWTSLIEKLPSLPKCGAAFLSRNRLGAQDSGLASLNP